MKIGKLINKLEKYKEDVVIFGVDLEDYGSERGMYYRFYIGKDDKKTCTVGELIEFLNTKVIGKEFSGYKGGDFIMDEDTPILMSRYSEVGDYIVDIQELYEGIKFYTIDSYEID